MIRRKVKKGKRKGEKARKIPNWLISIIAVGFFTILFLSYQKYFNPLKSNETDETPLKGAVIIDQFYSTNSKFTSKASELLRQVNMSVDIYKDENVTVALYRKLPTLGYRLLILRVHSGISVISDSFPTVLFTSEEYSTSRYVAEQLSDQIVCGFMGEITESEEIQPLEEVLAISPKFIEKSMKGNLRGAVIILSSCYGLFTPDLAEALVERGAEVFVSWDDLVNLHHTDEAILVFLEEFILEKTSIEEAVRTVMRDVGPDREYESVLRYYPHGSGNYTFWSQQ